MEEDIHNLGAGFMWPSFKGASPAASWLLLLHCTVEELTIDYRLNAHDDDIWDMRCLCAAQPAPHIVVGDFFALPDALQEAYAPWAPPFIREEYKIETQARTFGRAPAPGCSLAGLATPPNGVVRHQMNRFTLSARRDFRYRRTLPDATVRMEDPAHRTAGQ